MSTSHPASIAVRAYGRDALGSPFSAMVAASRISSAGALLQELWVPLSCGHGVNLEYRSRQAHFRVVWARDGQIAVHRCAGELCPWSDQIG